MLKKLCQIRYIALIALGVGMLGMAKPASAGTYWVRYYRTVPVVYHWHTYHVYRVYRPYW